jgi:hypothetical protein
MPQPEMLRLRWFGFRGDSMFMKVPVGRITTQSTACLEKLDLDLYKDRVHMPIQSTAAS